MLRVHIRLVSLLQVGSALKLGYEFEANVDHIDMECVYSNLAVKRGSV